MLHAFWSFCISVRMVLSQQILFITFKDVVWYSFIQWAHIVLKDFLTYIKWHAIVWKIKYGVRFEATQNYSDNLTYFILKICITHFQTMAALISLIVKPTLELWSVYFKDTTTYQCMYADILWESKIFFVFWRKGSTKCSLHGLLIFCTN